MCSDSNCATVHSEYTYDANGNRTGGSNDAHGTIVSAVYDDQDRLLSYETTEGGLKEYAYTANGDLAAKVDGAGTTTYVYDALGNLRHVTLPGGTEIEYLIDGRNRRIGKKVDGTLTQQWLYQDQLKPIAELDGAANLISQFIYGQNSNVPDYMIRDGDTYRILSDHAGSVRLVVDAVTGDVAQRIDYDEFGNATLAAGTWDVQPFAFAGGLYDHITRLVRFGARDYDAAVGRWVTKDPIGFEGGDANLYGYVLSDRVNHGDPSGKLFDRFVNGPCDLVVEPDDSCRTGFKRVWVCPVGRCLFIDDQGVCRFPLRGFNDTMAVKQCVPPPDPCPA